MRGEPTCEQAIRDNRRLRFEVGEMTRRERRARDDASLHKRRLEALTGSPWVGLPYLGVVPRYVGPGDTLRRIGRKKPR